MFYRLVIILCFICSNILGQNTNFNKNTDKFWEDQLYISLTYNTLLNKIKNINTKNFSYGLSCGYIKDIPLSRDCKNAIGIGLGYDFNAYNHSLKLTSKKLIAIIYNSENKTYQHKIELPIQFRWRNATPTKYEFWRVYLGIRFGYYLYNSENSRLKKKINAIKDFNSGIELSLGYNRVNFFVYHGLNRLYNKEVLETTDSNAYEIKFGLILYIL